jgi:hypothetical protein
MTAGRLRALSDAAAAIAGDEERMLRASRLVGAIGAVCVLALGGCALVVHAISAWGPFGGQHASRDLLTTVAQVDAGILVALAIDRIPGELPPVVVSRLSAMAAVAVFATAASLLAALWALVGFADPTRAMTSLLTDGLAQLALLLMTIGATGVAARLLAHGLDVSAVDAAQTGQESVRRDAARASDDYDR